MLTRQAMACMPHVAFRIPLSPINLLRVKIIDAGAAIMRLRHVRDHVVNFGRQMVVVVVLLVDCVRGVTGQESL